MRSNELDSRMDDVRGLAEMQSQRALWNIYDRIRLITMAMSGLTYSVTSRLNRPATAIDRDLG